MRGLLDYSERGEVCNVLQRLRKIKKGSTKAKAKLEDLTKYFDKRRERMHYATFRTRGLFFESIKAQPRNMLIPEPYLHWSRTVSGP